MRSLSAKLHEGLARDSVSGRTFGDPVAHPGGAVVKVVEVETTDDRSVAINKDEERAHAGILLIKQRLMMLSESLIERVAAVGQRPRKIGAILVLELAYRVQVCASQTLKLQHSPKYPAPPEVAYRTSVE